MLLAEQQGRDVPVNTDYRTHGLGHWRRRRYGHLVLVSLDHLDIVDYYEGDGQGFAPLLRWLSRDSWHGQRIGDALAVEIDDGVMDG
jgi:hypothetical protein